VIETMDERIGRRILTRGGLPIPITARGRSHTPIPKCLLNPVCILKDSEKKLLEEFFELFRGERNGEEVIRQMAEKREGTDKLDLTLRILTLRQDVLEALTKAAMAYLNWFRGEDIDFAKIQEGFENIRKRRKLLRIKEKQRPAGTIN